MYIHLEKLWDAWRHSWCSILIWVLEGYRKRNLGSGQINNLLKETLCMIPDAESRVGRWQKQRQEFFPFEAYGLFRNAHKWAGNHITHGARRAIIGEVRHLSGGCSGIPEGLDQAEDDSACIEAWGMNHRNLLNPESLHQPHSHFQSTHSGPGKFSPILALPISFDGWVLLFKFSVSLLRLIWRLRAYLIPNPVPAPMSQTFSRHQVLQTESGLDLLSLDEHLTGLDVICPNQHHVSEATCNLTRLTYEKQQNAENVLIR